jgi:hypothetical protein
MTDKPKALRQAIEQAEAQEPVANIRIDRHGDAYIDQYVDLPTGEHEVYTAPVHASDTSAKRVDETEKREHEWAGLTDEGMETLFLNEDGVRFARYIEAKLKEKNT